MAGSWESQWLMVWPPVWRLVPIGFTLRPLWVHIWLPVEISSEPCAGVRIGLSPTEDIPRLKRSFFDCIRSGKIPVANIELAIRGRTVLTVAEMLKRLELASFYDEEERALRTGDGKLIQPISYDTVLPTPAA